MSKFKTRMRLVIQPHEEGWDYLTYHKDNHRAYSENCWWFVIELEDFMDFLCMDGNNSSHYFCKKQKEMPDPTDKDVNAMADEVEKFLRSYLKRNPTLSFLMLSDGNAV